MEFEDMKKIWDEQNNENVYAINESELHRRVTNKKRSVNRMINKVEWTYLIAMFIIGIFAIYIGIQRDQWFKFIDAGIFLISAVYIFKTRLDRIKYEGQSNQSILGDVEQAIRSLEFHSNRQKYFQIWFLLPMLLVTVVNLAVTFNVGKLLPFIVLLIIFVLGEKIVKKELDCKINPKKEDLLHLRKLLLSDK